MAWTAPEIERREALLVADERQMLESWLDYQRDSLLWKCSGLTTEQLRMRTVSPSSMSLLGLLRHMTDVERSWFRRQIAREDVPPLHWSKGNEDGDFDDVDRADGEADYAAYLAEIETVRALISNYSLDDTFVHTHWNEAHSVRWVFNHMNSEYARHVGHADLLREKIDGATGE
jgi:uncharacterized damage-inducible protein DinB